jgi:hypothetical protein
MKISEVPIGHKFEHGIKGECTVIDKSKRTITVKHKFGKTKVTYRYSDATFSPSDF